MKLAYMFDSESEIDNGVSGCCGAYATWPITGGNVHWFNEYCKGLQFTIDPKGPLIEASPDQWKKIYYGSTYYDVKFDYDRVQLGEHTLVIKKLLDIRYPSQL